MELTIWRTMTHSLKKIRLEKLWTQEQLAEISGVSVRTIQRLENGEKASLETQRALAAALNLDISAIFPNEEDNSAPALTSSEAESEEMLTHQTILSPALKNEWIVFGVVIGLLAVINLINSPGHLWFIYPLLGWGAPLLIRSLKRRANPSDDKAEQL